MATIVHGNNGRGTGQGKGRAVGLETRHVSSPSVCFFSFFCYFLSTKLLFTFRTTGMTTNGPATTSKHLPLIGQSIYRTALLALSVVSYVSVSILSWSDSESHPVFPTSLPVRSQTGRCGVVPIPAPLNSSTTTTTRRRQ
jgi:hypothetical protein